jgi:hypothetical protein
MAATLRAADMAGDTLVIVEYLDHPMGEPHLDGAADQPVRHGIEGLVDLDMIVGMDLRRFPLGIFEGCLRQRLERRPFDLFEQFASAFADMAHWPVVQFLEQFGDRRVEFGQREEGPVPEPRQDPSLDDQHRALDLGLVARLSAAGWQDGGVVMLGKRLEGRVQRWLEPQCRGDTGLQVIAHDRLGDAAEEGERPSLTLDPVRQLLAQAGKGEGQVGGGQNRNKDLRRMNDAGHRIDHRHRLPGIVGLHHRTRLVALAEGRAGPLLEGRIFVAEPGEAVAVGMGDPVFLPQKRQRHTLALQVSRDTRPVRLTQVLGWAPTAMEQKLAKGCVVVPSFRQRPRQPRFPCPQQIGRYRRLADLQPFRHLAHGKTLFMGQAQDRSDILHRRLSRLLPSWHGTSQVDDERAKLPNGAAENRPPNPPRKTVRDLAESLSAI